MTREKAPRLLFQGAATGDRAPKEDLSREKSAVGHLPHVPMTQD